MYFERAKEYIYKNARPLDFARWEYLFEGGQSDKVLNILATYQNEDGGFGSGLEPDCWNPNSSPIQTWVATEIIKEVNLVEGNHPIIKGILRYLASGKDFDGHFWANRVSTNNDFPHAPWWQWEAGQEKSYNPTAALAGFIIKYAEKGSQVYELGSRVAKEAYDYFKANEPLESMHTAACFLQLYEYLKSASAHEFIDLEKFKRLINHQIKQVITYDKSKWLTEYVCKPSLFINSKESEFYVENKEIAEDEGEFIISTQNVDGTWAITWDWGSYDEEWAISKNWWKCDLIIKYVKYINIIGR